jgi:signal transduction histidine kinase
MSLRKRMIGGVTAVMVLVWAVVTLNLFIDSYARHQAHLLAEASKLGHLLGGEIGESLVPGEIDHWLDKSGLVNGWIVVSREGGELFVHTKSPKDRTLNSEDERLLRAALDEKRNAVIDDPKTRRAYVLLVGARRDYAARLDLKPEVTPPQFLSGKLWSTLAILGLGLVILVMLTYMLLNRLVIAPLSSIVQGSIRVSEGDYSRPIPAVDREDEVGTMIRAFNSMMEKLAAYHQTLQSDIKRARERITDTERKLFHAQRLSTTGTLAAGIAHEINNPLGGMMNAAEALKSGKLDAAKQAQYLELISDGLNRVKAIVQKILHFRPQAFQPVPVPVRETVDRAISFLDHKASRRGIEVRNDIEPGLDPVFGDALELQQAILNILMNAVDAAEPGKGKVAVSSRREGARVHIIIQDNGMGMTPEELERCMDPFYTTKDAGEGSGLGLPVAGSIVDNHGGRLHIRSEKGKGTTVTLDLPAGGVPMAGGGKIHK